MDTQADHERWMSLALDQAQKAYDQGEVPVGAVLVKEGEVLANGFNQPIGSNDPTAHAEIVCLRNAAKLLDNYRLVDSTLYVTIEPCAMCAGAMVHARVKALVYGATEPRAGAVESALKVVNHEALNHSIEVVSGVLADQCSAMMKRFFRERRQFKKEDP